MSRAMSSAIGLALCYGPVTSSVNITPEERAEMYMHYTGQYFSLVYTEQCYTLEDGAQIDPNMKCIRNKIPITSRMPFEIEQCVESVLPVPEGIRPLSQIYNYQCGSCCTFDHGKREYVNPATRGAKCSHLFVPNGINAKGTMANQCCGRGVYTMHSWLPGMYVYVFGYRPEDQYEMSWLYFTRMRRDRDVDSRPTECH